jgi:PAS domain S-box-containing protein
LSTGMNKKTKEQTSAEKYNLHDQNFFQFVVQNVRHYAIFATDRDGRIASWNPGVEHLLGYSKDEFVGRDISVIFTPEDNARKIPFFEIHDAETKGKGEDQRWHVRKDGSRFWANGLVMPLEADGEIYGFVKILRDDTPRKMMEIALREKEELYRAVVGNFPNGGVFVFDRDLRYIVADGKGLAAIGANSEMYVGKTIYEALSPEIVTIIEPLYRAALGGASGTAETEYSGRLYEIYYSPVKGDDDAADGEIRYAMVLTQDLTDRRRAEAAVRESEENYRTLFNSIDEGFCVIEVLFDEKGKPFDYRFLDVSPSFEKQTGITNPVGKTIREIAPRFEEYWFEIYGRVSLTGESVRFENRAEQLNRWYDVYAFRVGAPEERKVGVLFNDITARKRAEEQVEKLNRRNVDILDSITDAFFSLDRDWRFTYVNREAEKLLFRRAEDLLGKSVWDEFAEAVGSTFYNEYHRAVETGQTVTFEEYYAPLDSWFDVRAYPSSSGLSVYFHNVNERKQSEQALRETAAKLRLALEGGGMGWWNYDPATNQSEPDEKCLALFGLNAESYNGNADQIFEMIHAEDQTRVRNELIGAIETRGVYQTEFRVVHRDGSVRWLAGIGRAEYDADGVPRQMHGVNFDITERKEIEENLRKSEEQFRGLQQATPDGFMIFESVRDESGKIEDFRWLYVNPAAEKIIGRDEQDLIGKRLLVEMPGNRDEGLFDAYVRVVETGEVWRNEFSYAHEGLDHHFLSTAVKAGDGFAVAFSDITDRKRAEREREELLAKERDARAEAEAATRAKDEFLATVTHELRSPLNSILGWNAMLKKQPSPEMVGRVTQIIERQGKQQLQLIEDLLDTARIVAGKMKIEQHPVDLASVISAALDVVRPAAQSKKIALSMTINTGDAIVTGDAERLQQVIWNLLSNAVKFTPDGGRVEIELRREDPFAAIVVRDSGKGIAPEFLPYVFERFSQGDSSKSRRFGGLGLGLALVKQLTELHGGIVDVHSDGENKGAAFTVKFPIGTRKKILPRRRKLPEFFPAREF